MVLFSFGKRRKKSKKICKKPPAALLKRCRKYHVKTTMKRGKHRVYRKVSILKKLLARKIRKMKKSRKSRKSHKKTYKRRSHFGLSEYDFTKPSNYGYNSKVQQYPGTLSQTISTVTAKNNISRPEGFSFQDGEIPSYGVYRQFFGEQVPTQVPANFNFMGQPDGNLMAVGLPFQRYTTPNSFGKRRRYNVAGSACNKLKKRVCQSSPNCSYTRRGCRRRKGTKSGTMVYQGPALQFGKRRRRYNVAGSACNKLKKRVCQSSPNCSYTRRGCRRRKGTKSGAMVYEGPALQFGRRMRFI